MFFDYEFHALFTLFALILITGLCNSDYEFNTNEPTNTSPTVDLRHLNMSIYCKFQPSGYACNNTIGTYRRYFFDVHLKRCEPFEYGHCKHSYNMFIEKHRCQDECRDKAYDVISDNVSEIIYCRYQPDFGDCNSYYPSWYYDITDKLCKGFSYSGCGGNRNRFSTAIDCKEVCGSVLLYELE